MSHNPLCIPIPRNFQLANPSNSLSRAYGTRQLRRKAGELVAKFALVAPGQPVRVGREEPLMGRDGSAMDLSFLAAPLS
jgi:hypothetical protein